MIRFDGRPYLPAIYGVTDRNLVLRCSRQTEKSTFLVNTILFEACAHPGLQMLFVCPRQEQSRGFSRTRLLPAIEQSPLICRTLLGQKRRQLPVMNLEFQNGSRLFIRAAYNSADACRGLSAQLLMVDEFQDIAPGYLPVLQETLSHAAGGRMLLVCTPKSVENHLGGVFSNSTANEWKIYCPRCCRGVALDERCLLVATRAPHSVSGQSLEAEFFPT
ncbi:MAG: phage terminase large subunit family protein [Candidatus Sulfotelmatobacter sp.]